MAVIINPVNGQNAAAFDADDVSGLLVRFANQLISGADIPLLYPEFERTVAEYGSILADVRIPAPEGNAPDPETTKICGPYYFDFDAVYNQPWEQAQYAMEFRRVDLTKAVSDQSAFNDLLSRIMNATREGYQAETNRAMEFAFLGGTAALKPTLISYAPGAATLSGAISTAGTGWLNNTNRIEVLNTATWDDIVTEIRNIVDDMIRANTIYLGKSANNVGTKATANGYGARIEDLVVLMPYWLYNRMDTAYLQTLIRLQSVEAFPQIIKYGGRMTFTTDLQPAYPIIIMDRRVLLHVVRHMEYVSEDVRCRWSTVYQLNVEHGIKYCPWYKAYAIVTPMPTANNVSQRNVADIRTAVAADNPGAYSNMQVNMVNTTANVQSIKNNTTSMQSDVHDLRTAVAAPNASSYNSMQENVEAIRQGTVDSDPNGKAPIQTSVATGTQAAAASAEPTAAEPAAEEPTAAVTPDAKATSTKTSK